MTSPRDRESLAGRAVRLFFTGAAALGGLHPSARPERHGIRVIPDLDYVGDGEERHRLDVYLPAGAEAGAPRPAVLYIHGGGFRILSKDTHRVMAMAYARQGYVVFNVNYGLAPRHPFPGGLIDASLAYAWVVRHGPEYHADLDRLVVSGESAGANLTLGLLVATTFERPEPFARAVLDLGVVPAAVVPMCGLFQVTDPDRFARRKPGLGRIARSRIRDVTAAYLPEPVEGPLADLVDPIRVFERGDRPVRALPPVFLSVGTADPILDDTRRLASALRAMGAPVEARYYPGGMHAFQAFIFRSIARQCWADTHAFLARAVPARMSARTAVDDARPAAAVADLHTATG